MSYQLTFTEKPGFLHAVVTGQNTRANVAHYLEEVIRECQNRNYTRVLVEERLEGARLSTNEIFVLASSLALRFTGTLASMAYVDVHATDDRMFFAESVAVKRAAPVRVFATVAAAETWLALEHQRTATGE